ncbi:MAG: Gx transporter family protein [Oscillospiraceae bacterium]|nr:Gx transporter family protein [Oscillospiraceae bacterium]
MKYWKLTAISLFAAVSLALFAIELTIPLPGYIAGMKPGISNIVTLLLLNLGGMWKFRDVFAVLLIRVLLSVLITGVPSALIFSLPAGIAALCAMKLLKRNEVIIMSIVGALAHNITQLAIAAFMLSLGSVFLLLPLYLIGSIGAGVFTGLVVKFILKQRNVVAFLRGDE